MRAGYLEPSTCLRRPTTHRTRADTFAVPLLARVSRCSRRSHQHMRLYGSTGLEQKGNRSAPRSPTGTIVVSVGKRALARHLAHPDIGLPWSIEDFALLRVSAARALVRDILLLHRTSQHFTAFTARAVRRISDATCSLQRPCGPSVLPSRSSRVFIFLCEQLLRAPPVKTRGVLAFRPRFQLASSEEESRLWCRPASTSGQTRSGSGTAKASGHDVPFIRALVDSLVRCPQARFRTFPGNDVLGTRGEKCCRIKIGSQKGRVQVALHRLVLHRDRCASAARAAFSPSCRSHDTIGRAGCCVWELRSGCRPYLQRCA